MDFPPYFHRQLRLSYPATASALIAQTESNFQSLLPEISFARNSSNPIDRRLTFCAYFLATIQTLESHQATYEEIRALCLSVTEAYVQPRNAFTKLLRRLPGALIQTPLTKLLAAIMKRKTEHRGHPDGFLVQILTAPAQTNNLGYAFNILECGIVKLFAKHNAAHYAPILCEVDQLTSSLAGLELIRQSTIANGATICDFKFKKLPPRKPS